MIDLYINLFCYIVIKIIFFVGFGMGFICFVLIIVLGYLFEKYCGMVVGFIVMGVGFGIFGSGLLI